MVYIHCAFERHEFRVSTEKSTRRSAAKVPLVQENQDHLSPCQLDQRRERLLTDMSVHKFVLDGTRELIQNPYRVLISQANTRKTEAREVWTRLKLPESVVCHRWGGRVGLRWPEIQGTTSLNKANRKPFQGQRAVCKHEPPRNRSD